MDMCLYWFEADESDSLQTHVYVTLDGEREKIIPLQCGYSFLFRGEIYPLNIEKILCWQIKGEISVGPIKDVSNI